MYPHIKLRPIHQESYLYTKTAEPYFSDAYDFVAVKSQSIEYVYHGIFGYMPNWIGSLLKIRNKLVKPFGFKVGNKFHMSPPLDKFYVGSQAGFIFIEHLDEREVVFAAYEDKMSFWISVMNVDEKLYRVSTLVNLHSRASQVYLKIIKPFHIFITKWSIHQAMQACRV